jgi:hypothetical protein
MRRLPVFLAAILLSVALALALQPAAHADRRHMRKYKPPPPMAKVTVTVLKAATGKPVEHAAVVFHTQRDGEIDGNMELKTNDKGVASLDIIPVGSRLLVQVIARGFRTFGQEYDVPTDKKSITVKLLPPDQQYSTYKRSDPKSNSQTNSPDANMGHAAPADSPLLAPPQKKD